MNGRGRWTPSPIRGRGKPQALSNRRRLPTSPASGGGAAGAAQGDSPAVVRLQVILDRGRVGIGDRRAERLDHLGDLGVAGGAIAFDLLDAGRLLELDRLLVGARWQRDKR